MDYTDITNQKPLCRECFFSSCFIGIEQNRGVSHLKRRCEILLNLVIEFHPPGEEKLVT